MWASIFVFVHTAIALALVGRVLLRPRLEPAVRLAWIMVIEALPLFGIIAYLLFGEVRMNRAEVQRMADVRDRLTGLRRPSSRILREPPDLARPVIAANAAVGGMPALDGNRVSLLDESDAAIDDMVDAIDSAQDHVHVLFYIWLPDRSGEKIAEAIIRAEARGVECRVIVDALGSRGLVRSRLWRQMKEAGADCVTAFPWGLPFISFLFQRLDLRNHRKIVVVDNRIAFTGSRNCSDMAFAVKPRFAPWVDILMSVEGPLVRQLQSVFLADWMSYTGRDLGDMLEIVEAVDEPGMAAQIVATGPDRRAGSVSDCLTAMIHSARERVTITTPYYVPDVALDAAIRAAARRGVEVTMILPARNDSLVVGATSEGFYYGLLAAGVRLHLFRPGLLHAKIMTVDGRMAMVGSANLDRRSFELNYEVNMALFDPDFVAELDERQQSYVERAREISLQEVRGWSWLRRLRNNLLALASPLL
ncbi:cardiolipin synthase [Paracoccus saliphilus]|uniref:Cardiolipin synthase n=1 Tax=Paracoccus saliphilus TaxID=405559 RepID=A0AA45W158_9RHOB|nr:cardiolipin synthase [Paracoccus saliphilus]WCR03477.1 cardiolipin synthase [Paracoccus saliphilus]SIS54383.1 cardiolipin synthetase 2 [Paracoccus saliphilus]